MPAPSRTVSVLFAFATVLGLAACRQTAESPQDRGTIRLDAAAPADIESRPDEEQREVAAPAPVVAERAPQPPEQKPPAARVPEQDQPSPAEPANAEPAPVFVGAGTQMTATVQEEFSTARSRVDDRFHAALADDVLGANGEVLLPKGAVLNGRVAESHESSAADDPAALRVEIESVTVGERTLSLQADVVELEAEFGTRDSDVRTAVKVGAGAAAGAAIGRILGGGQSSTIKGAVAGAAAGTAVALATRDGQALVRAGARLVVRLTERVMVEP